MVVMRSVAFFPVSSFWQDYGLGVQSAKHKLGFVEGFGAKGMRLGVGGCGFKDDS